MFGNARGNAGLSSNASARQNGRGMFSVIGPDMAITGNISATADLHVDGRIEGDITCGVLIQGAGSQILGNVTAETARLAGTVEGSVRAKQLTVEASARITGDVEYETITVEQGGQVDGRLRHLGEAASGPRALPALALASSEAAA